MQLNQLYHNNCCTLHTLPVDEFELGLPKLTDEDAFAKQISTMVQQIWNDKALPNGLINKQVTSEFAKRLWGGVAEGYGSKATLFNDGKLDWNTPDDLMLKALKNNTWHFSAAKNYTQLRELGAALIGEDGKLRTYRQFKEVAYKINDKHVNQWLKAEYELAVAGGQMCSKWASTSNDAMLQFDAVNDARTTNTCKNLDGTTLPKTNSFWDKYYPPNHWGCRSTVRQVNGRAATTLSQIPSADIPPMFQSNLAKDGLVFPKGHSYFTDLPKDVLKKVQNIQSKEMQKAQIQRLCNNIKVERKELNSPINFNERGIKEAFNQPHKFKFEKNVMLQNIDAVISVADYMGFVKRDFLPIKHQSNTMLLGSHIFKTILMEEPIFLIVREYIDGIRFYSVSESTKVLQGI